MTYTRLNPKNYLPLSGGTMTGTLVNENASFISKWRALDRDGEAPSSGDVWGGGVYLRDADGENWGYLRAVHRTSGRHDLQLAVYDQNGDTNYFQIGVNNGVISYGIKEPAAFRSSIGLGTRHTDDVSTAVSVPTSTWKAIGSVTLAAGTWVITGNVQHAANATGRRHMCISTDPSSPTASDQRHVSASANAVSGGSTYLNACVTRKITVSTTYYLYAWQNSGANLSVYGLITAVLVG